MTLGGRRVPASRPRMRAADASTELPVESYETFTSTEVLGHTTMERMLAGLSTRRYPAGLEPVGSQLEQAGTVTSKSAVSRKFVKQTETALAELMNTDLSTLDWWRSWSTECTSPTTPLRWHWGSHRRHLASLALVEGSTGNATLARELIVGLRERGRDVTRPILAVIDGSKALRRAVVDVFDHPVITRCQLHKIRNVQDKLPGKLRSVVANGCEPRTTSTPP